MLASLYFTRDKWKSWKAVSTTALTKDFFRLCWAILHEHNHIRFEQKKLPGNMLFWHKLSLKCHSFKEGKPRKRNFHRYRFQSQHWPSNWAKINFVFLFSSTTGTEVETYNHRSCIREDTTKWKTNLCKLNTLWWTSLLTRERRKDLTNSDRLCSCTVPSHPTPPIWAAKLHLIELKRMKSKLSNQNLHYGSQKLPALQSQYLQPKRGLHKKSKWQKQPSVICMYILSRPPLTGQLVIA